jgi:peptide methionine sulfoxide reductase msrA/msrB
MVKEIYLAGGCFWGTEHYFKQIRGVISTEVGYANGTIPNPTYEEVYTDTTGYAETVHIVYDSDVVDLRLLIEMFFRSIDPTSLNQQGADCGTRYRTGIYYTDESDMETINSVYNAVAESVNEPLAVELCPLQNFYPAEEYHQDYLDKNPGGYCHIPMALMIMAKEANKR